MATGDRGKAVLEVAQKLMRRKRKKEVEEILLKQLSAESLSQKSLWAVPGWDVAGARAQLLGWSGQEQPPELGPELSVVST